MARGPNRVTAHREKPTKSPTTTSGQVSPKDKSGLPVTKVPLELQQKCLDVFRDAFKPYNDDNAILQEVKGHLYSRDFSKAFGRDDYLRVYASRWSPSRALAYVQVLRDVENCLALDANDTKEASFNVVCLGGGAGGELVGFSAWWSSQKTETPLRTTQDLQVTLVDVADWSSVVELLSKGVTTPPELSEYASQTKRDANKAILEASDVSVAFENLDLLDQNANVLTTTTPLFHRANVATFMFTLNELYTASVPRTQHLLSRITTSMRPGTFLLVVDSPGSYSTVSINGAEKKYPMQWLLDYTLLGPPNGSKSNKTAVQWEKLISDASRWFRLPENLQYPIGLEDMRYQVHLYRRLGG